ncbi:MAG: UDP-N-acetylmuramoyl-tripeptide--D-alanyl-D-alanine ligase [Sedimentitalea sp.]
MSAPLWRAKDAAEATQGRAIGHWQAHGVSIDTRTLVPGDLFVALKDVRDGHDFVAQALEKGAAAALVSHIPEGVPEDAPLLVVPDVLGGLENLGRAARARTEARIVAITGSVGKTSTKEMLAEMLGDQGRTHASVASYNNHWGVPLTLARMPADTEFAVIEIGMNHPGEIAPLSRLTRPHVALITTVAPAHLEAFDDIAAIAVEKAAILDGLEIGGVAVLNNDIDTAAILMAKTTDCRVRDIGFGVHGFDFVLKSVDLRDAITVVQATAHDQPLLFKLATRGRHFAMNALGALAAAEALGADLALAAQSLGRWSPFVGRGVCEVITLDAVDPDLSFDLIDDAYNANPASMAAALDVLAASPVRDATGRIIKGRRIAILGDMKELGPTGLDLHRDLAELPAMAQIDRVHCIGPLSKALFEALPEAKRGSWHATSAELVPDLRRAIDAGDVVLTKGSLSMNIGLIVDAIRKMGHSTAIQVTQDDE